MTQKINRGVIELARIEISKTKEILILTSIASHYRKGLWLKLLNTTDFNYSFAFGEGINSSIHYIPLDVINGFVKLNRMLTVKNIFLGRILVWQLGAVRISLKSKYSVIIFMGDFYCLSTWLSAIICRLRGVRVVFWGHGIYGNESKIASSAESVGRGLKK